MSDTILLTSRRPKTNTKRFLNEFVTVFAVTLAASVIVTLLWNLVVYRAATVDWESSVRFAILFGIVLSWIDTRRGQAR